MIQKPKAHVQKDVRTTWREILRNPDKLLQCEHIWTCTVKLSLKQYLLFIFFSGLAACTTAPPPPPPLVEEPEVAVVEAEEVEEIEYGSFTEDQLYQTIVSELGAQRGDLEEAGDNYLDLAMETRDLSASSCERFSLPLLTLTSMR